MKPYTRDNVQTHGTDYSGRQYPAVNVKVHRGPESVALPLELSRSRPAGSKGPWTVHRTDAAYTHEWIDANLDDEARDFWWAEACRVNFETAEEDARDILGAGVKVYSAGRSGGWLVVDGLPDLDSWDAVHLGKWRRFEKHARLLADDVPRAYLELVYFNVFEPKCDACPECDGTGKVPMECGKCRGSGKDGSRG